MESQFAPDDREAQLVQQLVAAYGKLCATRQSNVRGVHGHRASAPHGGAAPADGGKSARAGGRHGRLFECRKRGAKPATPHLRGRTVDAATDALLAKPLPPPPAESPAKLGVTVSRAANSFKRLFNKDSIPLKKMLWNSAPAEDTATQPIVPSLKYADFIAQQHQRHATAITPQTPRPSPPRDLNNSIQQQPTDLVPESAVTSGIDLRSAAEYSDVLEDMGNKSLPNTDPEEDTQSIASVRRSRSTITKEDGGPLGRIWGENLRRSTIHHPVPSSSSLHWLHRHESKETLASNNIHDDDRGTPYPNHSSSTSLNL
ncbi:hypothetical protein BDR26DRAFT_868401 [Obelidium mucronatum]|nr:hypothetical protein BDR26DRAFT_868401 [Obelidium mucronatum]